MRLGNGRQLGQCRRDPGRIGFRHLIQAEHELYVRAPALVSEPGEKAMLRAARSAALGQDRRDVLCVADSAVRKGTNGFRGLDERLASEGARRPRQGALVRDAEIERTVKSAPSHGAIVLKSCL